jgi:hypothetical protein
MLMNLRSIQKFYARFFARLMWIIYYGVQISEIKVCIELWQIYLIMKLHFLFRWSKADSIQITSYDNNTL